MGKFLESWAKKIENCEQAAFPAGIVGMQSNEVTHRNKLIYRLVTKKTFGEGTHSTSLRVLLPK